MALTAETALRKDRMTRTTLGHRHFAAIAAIIDDMHDDDRLGPAEVERVAKRFARKLAETNPRFDRERFLRACGV